MRGPSASRRDVSGTRCITGLLVEKKEDLLHASKCGRNSQEIARPPHEKTAQGVGIHLIVAVETIGLAGPRIWRPIWTACEVMKRRTAVAKEEAAATAVVPLMDTVRLEDYLSCLQVAQDRPVPRASHNLDSNSCLRAT